MKRHPKQIFLKPTEPKPTEADLHDERYWCSADYTHHENHKRSIISEDFVRRKLRDHWKEGISEVELIWHTKDSGRYRIAKFHVEKMQKHSAPIKFGSGSNKTPYIPSVVALLPPSEAVDINDETKEQTTDEPRLFQPNPVNISTITLLAIAGKSFSPYNFLVYSMGFVTCLLIIRPMLSNNTQPPSTRASATELPRSEI